MSNFAAQWQQDSAIGRACEEREGRRTAASEQGMGQFEVERIW